MLKALRNVLVQLMLLLCMPALIAQPIDPFPPPQNTILHQILSYDEIIELIHKVESGEFDNSESSKEIAQVNKILTLLATAGSVFEGEEKQCFQNSIASLLNHPTNTNDFRFQISDLPSLICDISSFNSPQLSGDKSQICDIFSHDDLNYYSYTPCCCIQNVWKKTKKFLAKYKTEIIIGAAVIVAVVIIFSSMGTAAAPVAALAGIAEVTPETSKCAPAPIDYQIPLFTGREEALLFPKESPSHLDFNSPEIQQFFNVKELHEHASYNSSFPIEERIREAMAYEMHIGLDIVAESYNYTPLIDMVPAPLTGLYGILQQEYFKETGETHLATKFYEKGVKFCHKAVDFVFSTNQANAFSPEEKAKNSWNYSDLSLLASPKGILKGARFLEKSSKNFFIKPKEAIQPFTKSNLRLGQQMHNSYRAGEIILNKKTKEFILPSRRRIDFLDIENGKVYELKPNNPRAILEGKKQLARYIEELKTIPKLKDIEWEGILETY